MQIFRPHLWNSINQPHLNVLLLMFVGWGGLKHFRLQQKKSSQLLKYSFLREL